MIAPPVRHRRGASMMLVLIALGTSAVLTSAFLASRDNSAIIGANIGSTSSARWAATTGVEMAIAVTQTDTPWRTNHVGGVMIDDFAVGDVSIDVTIVDLATGKPPTATSRTVEITSVASTGNIRQTALAVVTVGSADGDPPDPDLSDFVVFGRDKIELQDDTTIARWPNAPLADQGRPLALGTNATDSGKVTLRHQSATVDGVLYHGPGASSTLLQIEEGPSVDAVEFQDTIPMPSSPDSGVPAPDGSVSADLDLMNQTATLAGDEHWRGVTLTGAELHVPDGATLIVDDRLTVQGSGLIVIDGRAKVIVYGDVMLDTGQIMLSDSGELYMHVQGRLQVTDGYIGNREEPGAPFDLTGTASWMDPGRIEIYDMGANGSTWLVEGASLVKGSLYLGGNNFEMRNDAALYGRVAAMEVTMKNNASVFYDHGLDSGGGYTSETSMAFDENGRIQTELRDLESLDDAAVESAKSAIEARGAEGKIIEPDPIGPTATPRTVRVEVRWQSIGANPTGWESAVAGTAP